MVSSTEPRIEHFRREPDGWKIHDLRGEGTVRLQALDITLDLAELYAGGLPQANPGRASGDVVERHHVRPDAGQSHPESVEKPLASDVRQLLMASRNLLFHQDDRR